MHVLDIFYSPAFPPCGFKNMLLAFGFRFAKFTFYCNISSILFSFRIAKYLSSVRVRYGRTVKRVAGPIGLPFR